MESLDTSYTIQKIKVKPVNGLWAKKGSPGFREILERSEITHFDSLNVISHENIDQVNRLNGKPAALQTEKLSTVLGMVRINNVRRINRYFEHVNENLQLNGLFVGCVETKEQRKERILSRRPRVFWNVYYYFNFVYKRIFPKLPVTKQIYFALSKGKNRVISLAETLGRLTCCGFEIIDHYTEDGLTWFSARKKSSPCYDMCPTYGPICKLKRVGKGGRIINIYKLRTMHPYSEYIQDYVFNNGGLTKGGKFSEDFRITTWGAIFRKFWLDEQPMWLNWLKGDVKLIGVRALSRHYFSMYPKDMQEYRIRFKPGLIPPFYVDLPETLEEIVESERKYLQAYEKNPWKTDIRYFISAINNIFFKLARSK